MSFCQLIGVKSSLNVSGLRLNRIFSCGISRGSYLSIILIIYLISSDRWPLVKAKKWTAEQLKTSSFPYLTTNDLYMDLNKTGGFLNDIALTRQDVQEFTRKKKSFRRATVSSSHVDSMNRPMRREKRAATGKPERVWQHGVIPFEIQANFSGEHHALFRRAMLHWENYTCLSFVPKTSEDDSYIVFTVAECGCCSFVGRRGEGPQAISIGKNCDKFGIVVHELGHVVGFWHEHTRPDRDEFVDIYYSNIQHGQNYNFAKLELNEVDSMGQPYDFASIMHYARDTFPRNMYLDTILPRASLINEDRPEIGQRIRLSPGDITQTKLLYKCTTCGETLTFAKGSFYPPKIHGYKKYGKPSMADPLGRDTLRCQWRIIAPMGSRIQLNIGGIGIPDSANCRGADYLEIRDGHYLKSPLLGRYCGKFGPIYILSQSNRLWIEYSRANSIAHSDFDKPSELHSQPSGFFANYEAKCGGHLIADDGIIESTNYPHDYAQNSDCVWLITVPETHQVAIIFILFQIEQHDNCIYDYLEFRDGHESTSPLLGRYCGYSVANEVKASGNKMRIKFASDASVEKAGFSLKFIKEFDECSSPHHGCQHKCVNTIGSYKCECDIGYELHADGKSCEDACGGYLRDENGTLTSPNFPAAYPNKKRCIWEIEARNQHKITLNFTHFDLEGVYTSCEYDYLKITSVDDHGNVIENHGTFCGKVTSNFLVTSGTNHLRIEFSSDGSVAKSGFAAIYFTDKDECDINNGGCEQICRNIIGSYQCECEAGYVLAPDGHNCKEGGCKFELVSPSGSVVSPGYPGLYPNRKECIWHFVTTPGHRLQLDFSDFEIEQHQDCAYDRIELYDGPDSNSQPIGRFCGPRQPEKILTTSNELFLIFKSDSSVQRKGFKARFNTVCGGTLVASRTIGYIYSHATYGGVSYDTKMYCDWMIMSRDQSPVALRFTNFDLEDEYNCEYDYVDIYDGDDEEDDDVDKIGRFCGSKLPPLTVSSGTTLRLHFRSDDTVGFKGFLAEYYLAQSSDRYPITRPRQLITQRPLEPVINERIKSRFRD